MATIIHFDIPADNPERAKTFYTTLFGWKFNLMPGPDPYYLIETNNLDGHAGTGGGMGKRSGPDQRIVNYIGVSSIDESIKQVLENGGKVQQEKQQIPGFGFLAVCVDTENNLFGLFEETPPSK
jgi:predicted enzyme related to lactoylglutathione lyase